MTQETLRERWNSKAQEIGLEVERTLGPEAGIPAPPTSPHGLHLRGRPCGYDGGFHFDRRDVIQAVAGLAQMGWTPPRSSGRRMPSSLRRWS